MADDVSYSPLTVARKRLNQSGEWNIVDTDIYCGHEYGSVLALHRQTDCGSFMTSHMDSPRYHQQFIREDTVNSIFAASVFTTLEDTILSLELTVHQSVFL
jgi:hypothetical protein